jgi:hypothetical protein
MSRYLKELFNSSIDFTDFFFLINSTGLQAITHVGFLQVSEVL